MPSLFSAYHVMLILGAFSALIMLNVFMKKGHFSKFVKKRVRRSLTWAAALATVFSNIANWFFHKELMSLSIVDRFANGGTAFIVWILCFLGFSALFLRLYKLDLRRCLDIVAPPLLLATALARVGCLLGGCCYGRPMNFGEWVFSFPIRETEAVFAFVLCILLCCKFKGKRLGIYLIAYPLFRFAGEFLRGDDRGMIFNISVLSPTQIISAAVVIITTAALVINAVKKTKTQKAASSPEDKNIPCQADTADTYTDKTSNDGMSEQENGTTADDASEHSADGQAEAATPAEASAEVDEKGSEKEKKPKKERRKYVPRPVDFDDPRIKSNPLRIILTVLAVICIAFTLFFAYNPFGMTWVENANYYIQDKLGFLFDERTTSNEIGDTDGLSVLSVSGEVNSNEDALKIINSYDTWHDVEYTAHKIKDVGNGYKIYTFLQSKNDLPVFGKASSVVVDANGDALFMIKDDADSLFTDNAAVEYIPSGITYESYMSKGDEIISRTECLYDVGSGVVEAELLCVSDGEREYGILTHAETKSVIKLLADGDVLSGDARAEYILSAADEVLRDLNDGNDDEIKAKSKDKFKTLELQNVSSATESALCKAYLKLELDREGFASALEMTAQISEQVPNLNEQLFCNIFTNSLQSVAMDSGHSEKETDKYHDTVKDAFKASGIRQNEDEKTVFVNAKTKKSTVKNTLGSANDVDVIKLHMAENSFMNIEISGDAGIDIQVYSESGEHIVTTYSSSEQSFSLYSADGTDYVMKLKASAAQQATWGNEEDYKVTVSAEEEKEQMPSFVNTTMYSIAASFSSSKGQIFGLMFYGDAAYSSDAYTELCLLPVADNCSTTCSSCTGEPARIKDTVKKAILAKLLISYEPIYEMTIDPNTVMEICCSNYIRTENGALVKAKIKLTDVNGVCYEGYSFFKMELVTELDGMDEIKESASTEELKAAASIFEAIFSNKYYITEINTEEIMNAFGDTEDNISSTNEMPSLYDYWYVKPGDYLFLREFDRQGALNAGFSEERVDEFEKFTVRHNIAYCEKTCDNIDIICSSLELYSTGVVSGHKLYSIISDPIGALIDENTDNIYAKAAYRIGKLAWGVYTGNIKDISKAITGEAMDDLVGEGVKSYADQLEEDIKTLLEEKEKVEKLMNEYKAELARFKKRYFWEYIF